ncbi:hypothetical protein NOR53_1702 [gamma proteobacterium NOR5-3]|nr:hypothetical protein NOR53_1702 [gamma proteobacterium NOR5-3]
MDSLYREILLSFRRGCVKTGSSDKHCKNSTIQWSLHHSAGMSAARY